MYELIVTCFSAAVVSLETEYASFVRFVLVDIYLDCHSVEIVVRWSYGGWHCPMAVFGSLLRLIH